MESFFGSLKAERGDGQPFGTRHAAKAAVFSFLEGFYDRRRSQSAVGYRSPIDMEQIAAATQRRNPCPPIRGKVNPVGAGVAAILTAPR